MKCGECKFFVDECCELLAVVDGNEFYDLRPEKHDGCTFGKRKPEVVHCRECKHLADLPMRFECNKGYLAGVLSYNDYCSRGEPRDKS